LKEPSATPRNEALRCVKEKGKCIKKEKDNTGEEEIREKKPKF